MRWQRRAFSQMLPGASHGSDRSHCATCAHHAQDGVLIAVRARTELHALVTVAHLRGQRCGSTDARDRLPTRRGVTASRSPAERWRSFCAARGCPARCTGTAPRRARNAPRARCCRSSCEARGAAACSVSRPCSRAQSRGTKTADARLCLRRLHAAVVDRELRADEVGAQLAEVVAALRMPAPPGCCRQTVSACLARRAAARTLRCVSSRSMEMR